MDAVLGLPEGVNLLLNLLYVVIYQPKEECLRCGLKLPLGSLKGHIKRCGR